MSRKAGARVRPAPQRTCVSCREVLAKRQLIRIVRTPEGIRVDASGKAEGRGAYLHRRRACWEQALRGPLEQALRIELTEADRALLATWIARMPGTEGADSNSEVSATAARRPRSQQGDAP